MPAANLGLPMLRAVFVTVLVARLLTLVVALALVAALCLSVAVRLFGRRGRGVGTLVLRMSKGATVSVAGSDRGGFDRDRRCRRRLRRGWRHDSRWGRGDRRGRWGRAHRRRCGWSKGRRRRMRRSSRR